MTTDGKVSDDSTVADTPIVACPTIIELEAGVIFNMTCYINKVTVAELELVTQRESKYTTSITALGDNFVQVLLYKSVAIDSSEIIFMKAATVNSEPINATVRPTGL